jgi:ABC-type lipoprotein release transport system permease subunit
MFSNLALNTRIGFYLALRQIKRSSLWTTGLIVFVMVLTFLNLVVVSGILVGLIQGAVEAARTEYTSDVIISTLADKKYIENSPNIIALLKTLPQVVDVSARYQESAVIEANYKTRKETDKPDVAGAQIVGINPIAENDVTGLAGSVAEGSYLAPGDYDKVLVGQYLLQQYVPVDSPGFAALENVFVGTKIRVTIEDLTREFTVKGILKTKVDEITRNVYITDTQLRSMIDRADGNVDQIVVKLQPNADPLLVRDALRQRGVDQFAKVQTYADAQPQFLKDIIATL